MEPGGIFDREDTPEGPSAALRLVLLAFAVCAVLMAVTPADVAGAGLLPPLGKGPPPSRPVTTNAPPPAPGHPIAVAGARVRQREFSLRVWIQTAAPLRRTDLTPGGRVLCVSLRGAPVRDRVVCPKRARDDSVGSRSVRFSVPLGHLRPGRVRYSVVSLDSSCTLPRAGCLAAYPHRPRTVRVVRPRAEGCRRRGREVVRGGTRRGRRVALTFDDGPGPYTPAVLRALKRVHAHATFFQIGRQIAGDERVERKMVRLGHSIGDHSFSHPRLPGKREIASTKNLIERDAGYHPCLFRPPYGAVDSKLERRARRLGLTAVLWDVDPSDYERPGIKAIVQRVMAEVHPGSIIVMHDGGGDRSETVKAVPYVVRALRRHHYRLVTVDRLLGYKRAYSP